MYLYTGRGQEKEGGACIMMAKKKSFLLIYLVPTLLLYGVFCIYPCAKSLFLSLCSWNGFSDHIEFAGLDNFRRLIGDPVVWKALGNNVFILIFCTLFTFVLALAFAIFVTNKKSKFRKGMQIIYFIPYVMSLAVVSVLWDFIYNPSFGLVNGFLNAIGLEELTHVWLGEADVIMGALTVPLVWINVGFYMILFMSAIMNIPEERYEAAAIDGATKWQQFRYVTIPGIWQEIRTALIFFCVTAFNYSFELVYVMTEGGPNRASELLTTYLYQNAFTYSDYGYASAIGVLLFAILFVIIFVVMKVMKVGYRDD